MDKEDMVYIHTMEYYWAIEKNEILPFVTTQMGLEDIMLSEISQTEKDKYCTQSLICGIQTIQQTTEYNKKEADSQIYRTN